MSTALGTRLAECPVLSKKLAL